MFRCNKAILLIMQGRLNQGVRPPDRPQGQGVRPSRSLRLHPIP